MRVHRELFYLFEKPPEDCLVTIIERMKTCECAEGKWLFCQLEAELDECLSVDERNKRMVVTVRKD